jgi:hypothetical protein
MIGPAINKNVPTRATCSVGLVAVDGQCLPRLKR